jgi:hypothetical protein
LKGLRLVMVRCSLWKWVGSEGGGTADERLSNGVNGSGNLSKRVVSETGNMLIMSLQFAILVALL